MCLLARRLKSITTFAGLHFGSSSIFNSLNLECISLILVLLQTANSFSSVAACILFWALQSSLLPINKKKKMRIRNCNSIQQRSSNASNNWSIHSHSVLHTPVTHIHSISTTLLKVLPRPPFTSHLLLCAPAFYPSQCSHTKPSNSSVYLPSCCPVGCSVDSCSCSTKAHRLSQPCSPQPPVL